MTYIINNKANTTFKTGRDKLETIDILIFERAVHEVHHILDLIIKDIPIDIFSILGMRNLSAFVGELFAKSLANESSDRYRLPNNNTHNINELIANFVVVLF